MSAVPWGIPAMPAGFASPSWGIGIRQGSGVPSDASGNLGDRYFDTTAQRWYLKRWVANREGVGDKIIFPINLFPSVGDFDFEMLVRMDIVQAIQMMFAATSPSASDTFNFRTESTTGKISGSLRTAASLSQYFILDPASRVDAGWIKIGMRRVGFVFSLLINGLVVVSNASTSAWSPVTTNPGTAVLTTTSGATESLKACNVKLTGPGGSIIAPLNEGAGTTITNQAGANGTLTDGTPTNFWYQAWVPMDLL